MDYILHAPAFAKIGLSFFGILAVYRFGIPLGYSILMFAGVLTLWTGTGSDGISYQGHSLSDPENYTLLIVILLLQFFTEALNQTGKMKRTIGALQDWLRNKKVLLVGFPALVGLLPMPGGALFSAPLVDAVDSEKDLKPEHKVAINYWFRHIWEYWWPLYPGIILAIKYSGLPSGVFYLIQIPFTIAAFAGGYFFIIRIIRGKGDKLRPGKLDGAAAFATLFPISVLVTISLLGSFLLPHAGISKTLSNLLGMIAGLSIGLVIIFAGNMAGLRKSIGFFKKKNTIDMMLLVLGIQIFSAALTIPLGGEMTLVSSMRDEFLRLGIPILFVIALIPFVSGAVTGVAFGFVGASFPIVFAMIGPNQPTHVLMAATTFAYGFGYVGMILSPVHICFVVTNEYFKTKIFSAYKYILMPLTVVLLSGCAMSAAYYFLF
jgi:integral membrane protein (TIGR00529 family)